MHGFFRKGVASHYAVKRLQLTIVTNANRTASHKHVFVPTLKSQSSRSRDSAVTVTEKVTAMALQHI